MKTLKNFFRDETGATAIEYALILAGIAVVIIAAAPTLAAAINNLFGRAGNAIG